MKFSKAFYVLLILASVMQWHLPEQREKRVAKNDLNLSQRGKFLYYMNKPFSGILEEVYDDGLPRRQSEYHDGLMNGFSWTWYASGMTESIRTYVKGEKDGLHKGWWASGGPMFEYSFVAGRYQGAFKEWYQNGDPLHEFTYNNGEVLRAVGWRENGKTYLNFVVRAGRMYGLTNARLCYSLIDEKGSYTTSTNLP
jgi:antitoxin component YwqK of YwqJK toxin-antitoxin module